MLFGLLVRGLAVAAAAVAVTAIVIKIYGTITKDKIEQELRNRGVNEAIIEKIDNCSNQVSLKDLENGNTYEVRGDDVDYCLDEGDVIYC